MEKTVTQINKVITKPILQQSDIAYLMTLFRVLLEEENLQKEFPYLNLYSTWVVHPKLDRDSTSLQVLMDLTSVFRLDDPIGKKLEGELWIRYFYVQINKALGFPLLRNEIMRVLTHFKIPIGRLPIDRVWIDFALLLLSCLYERPIKIPEENKRNKKTYEVLHRLSNGDPKREIVEISFMQREKAEKFGERKLPLSQNIDIYWQLKTSANTNIIGPLQLFF